MSFTSKLQQSAAHGVLRIFMNLHIRPVCDNDVDDLVRLSLLAWAPVFSSFEQILGPEIYPIIYPDWQKS
ncbi:MAG TPA: hypothetical protein VM243_15930, partial [Phycisphaerae bacterium]|nr:hypothetical protein [Phycisphaerae bacterium]